MISLKKFPGRFGNHFFRNIVLHFLVEKYNLSIEYESPEKFEKLGIIFKNGSIKKRNLPIIHINDNNILNILNENQNISAHDFAIEFYSWFQKKEIALKIYDYFHNNDYNKKMIINANIFKERINNNNDVFIHVRLGDVPHLNPGYAYYDKLLSNIVFDNGYISSDTINDEICKKLIQKYNLKSLEKNEIETIMFANTCKYLILSQGTFSWMMGIFNYNAEKIYFPKIKRIWHGDIYVFPGLIEVDY
jgi:hypothetical protein